MSIIQEALKKAQGKIEKTFQTAPTPDETVVTSEYIKISPASQAEPVVSRNTSGDRTRSAGHDPRAVAILLVLLVIAAYLALSQLFEYRKNTAAAAKEPPKEMTAATESVVGTKGPSETKGSIFKDISVVPSIIFKSSEEKTGPESNFELNGIMYIEGSPRAIINDAMVEIGDTVAGALVLRIEKRSVTLLQNDTEITLNLK